MRIEISNRAFVLGEKAKSMNAIRDELQFVNPKYLENIRLDHSNWCTPTRIEGFELVQGGLVIPRGATGLVIHLARQHGEPVQIVDHRRVLPEVDFEFRGKLRDYQERAVNAVLQRDFGVLQAPTGSGKTTMALAVVASRRQPALIVVHTGELLRQWIDRAVAFLGLDPAEIGVIGGGRFKIGEKLTVALVQSLYGRAQEVARRFQVKSPQNNQSLYGRAQEVAKRVQVDPLQNNQNDQPKPQPRKSARIGIQM
jgi:hypothetical protein